MHSLKWVGESKHLTLNVPYNDASGSLRQLGRLEQEEAGGGRGRAGGGSS